MRRRLTGVIALAILCLAPLGLALTGCSTGAVLGSSSNVSSTPPPMTLVPTPTPTHATDQSIQGNWRLVSGRDAMGKFDIDKAVITLDVNGDRSGGKGPCNAYGASITSTKTGPIAVTEGIHAQMTCADPARTALEARYFADLAGVANASLTGQDLVLAGDDTSLEFVPMATQS